MKKLIVIAASAAALLPLASALSACRDAKASDKNDYASYVDPFIGTGGHGHTFPGAVVPHGMIQPSPDTRIDGWDACSGYYYGDSLINGFSHTHVSGTGCADYGDLLIMPTVGDQVIDNQTDTIQNLPYASPFSHDREVAEPGYYSVMLDRYGIKAEMTANERVAIHRFTFPKTDKAGMIVDMDYSIQRQNNLQMAIEVVNDTTLRAWKLTEYWAFDQQAYFCMQFSRPFTHTMVTDTITDSKGRPYARCKALLQFPPMEEGEQLLVKVAYSAVDYDGAAGNLAADMKGFDFDDTREEAREEWNEYLGTIEVDKNADPSDLRKFYTALYHTGVSPFLFSDADGRYLGMDLKTKQGDEDEPVYTVFSLWDTFRALHPLLSIIDPDLNNDFIRSLLLKGQEGGVLPKWELAANYTGTMIGYHSVSLMADAIAKGQADFPVDEALRQALRTARYDTAGIHCPPKVLPHLMPMAKYYKNTLGYIPSDKENESVAKALEYAYNDWCIAQIAKAAGDTATAAEYEKFGKAYKRYFDPATGFMRGVMSDGSWRTPFSPNASNHRNDDYCEGTAWQWTWFVPQDVPGLMELMGGKEKFAARLDSLFSASSELTGELVSADITGLIGQYAHGNEPSHHIIHLYNYAGQPWKTQELIGKVFEEQYRDEPDGLSGNEDCGQMSAWLVMNAMGIYQVCPGDPVYSIGRPMFREMTVNLPDDRRLTVKAPDLSAENRYIQSVTFNGKPLEKPFISHADLMKGGELSFFMTSRPTRWGADAEPASK